MNIPDLLAFLFLWVATPLVHAQSWQTGANGPSSGFVHLLKTANGDIWGVTVKSEFIFTPSFRIDYTTEVYKSTDQGATFSSVATGLLPDISSVVALKEYNGELFVVGQTGFGANPVPNWLASSSDGGATWTETGGGQEVRAAKFHKEGSDLYALSNQSTTFTSNDAGATWTSIGGLASFPDYTTVGSRRFYHTSAGLKYSDDLGVTQTTVLPGNNLNGDFVVYGGTLYAHFNNGKPLFTSTDNGLTWSSTDNIPGYPDQVISNLFEFDSRLFAATSTQVSGEPPLLLFTTDGTNWAPLTISGQPSVFSHSFAAGNNIISRENGVLRYLTASIPTGPPTFLAAPQDATVGIGTQHSLSFYATGQGPLTYQWYEGPSGDTSSPIAGATGSLYKTDPLTEAAEFWVRVTGGAGTIDSGTVTVTAIEIWTNITDFINPASMNFVGPFDTPTGLTVIQRFGSPNSVYKSTDAGQTWSSSPGPNGISSGFYGYAASNVYSNGLYLSARDQYPSDPNPGFATSTDGINWTELGKFPVRSSPEDIVRDGDNIYIADRSSDSLGFFRSTDGGLTFTTPATGLDFYSSQEIILTDNGTLVISSNNRAVSTSTDGGTTWTQRYFVGTNAFSNASDLHYHDGVLYAALDRAFSSTVGRGLWKSTDDGATWSQVAFSATELESVVVVDDKIVVSQKGTSPLFHISSDGGATFDPLTNAGLTGIDPDKLIAAGDHIFVSSDPTSPGQQLFRLRIGDNDGEQVTITTQPEDQTILLGETATLSVGVDGPGPVTYEWLRGDTGFGVTVGTDPTYTTDPSLEATATFFVRVTNGFGEPVASNVVTVTVLQPPAIVSDFTDKAYFSGSTAAFGPSFSFFTPADTVYQWYRGDSGDTSTPIAGATSRTIGPPTVSSGDRVWLQATANGTTVNSAAGTFTALSSTAGTLDLISRDPDGRTWDEGANSHLAEDGSFAFFGSPDPGEGSSRHPLPYAAPQFIDETPGGEFGFGNSDDISNTGRFLLFSRGWVHGMDTGTSSATFNPAGGANFANAEATQISSSGQFVLFKSSDAGVIPNDDNGRTDIFLHNRSTGAVQGITRFPDGSGNVTVNSSGHAEIDQAEQFVFFSHFATDPLISGEDSTLYVYEISSRTLSVPTPLQGMGPYATFLDASSNGRFILFGWNPALQALRPSEPIDSTSPRHWLYVYDRQLDELSFVDIPFGAEYTTDHTISNDGGTVAYIHFPSLTPYVAVSSGSGGTWANKTLIDTPTPSGNTADLQMSDDGSSFIYSTLLWSLQTPQYSTGSGGELNVVNVMYLSGVTFGPAPPVPTFADWASTELSGFPANLRGENDDADGDGVPNIIAFLSGRTAASPPGPALTTQISSGGEITITFRQRTDTVRKLIPQFSSNLGATGWDDISALEISRIEVEPGVWEITVAAPASAPSDPKFFRLFTSS